MSDPDCVHPSQDRTTHRRGDFKLVACNLCQSWWEVNFPDNVKPYPLPPRASPKKPETPAGKKRDGKSYARLAELADLYAGGSKLVMDTVMSALETGVNIECVNVTGRALCIVETFDEEQRKFAARLLRQINDEQSS